MQGEELGAPRGAVDVLLVEDEPVILMVASDMLSDAGYRVRECGSAEEAMAALEGGYRPHILVADHSLPGLSGTDLAIHITDSIEPDPGGWTPQVLIASGDSGRAAGRFATLAKPYREEELLEKVAALVRAGCARADRYSDGPAAQ